MSRALEHFFIALTCLALMITIIVFCNPDDPETFYTANNICAFVTIVLFTLFFGISCYLFARMERKFKEEDERIQRRYLGPRYRRY